MATYHKILKPAGCDYIFSPNYEGLRREEDPVEHLVPGGVPQRAVVGPFLWNAMYEYVLHFKLPR